jgi:large subunit ribosomal protein L13
VKKYTYSAKRSDNEEKWCLFDANGAVLGRLATQVAHRLRGKHNPLYTPHADTGDWVIVINADKIALTGRKMDQKVYYRHSGHPGGIYESSAREVLAKRPEKAVELAVWGMLPKNKLGRRLYTKLHVYRGADHPHRAQKPKVLKIETPARRAS